MVEVPATPDNCCTQELSRCASFGWDGLKFPHSKKKINPVVWGCVLDLCWAQCWYHEDVSVHGKTRHQGLQWNTPKFPWLLSAQSQPGKLNLPGYLETETPVQATPSRLLCLSSLPGAALLWSLAALSRQITTCHMIRSLGQRHRGFA